MYNVLPFPELDILIVIDFLLLLTRLLLSNMARLERLFTLYQAQEQYRVVDVNGYEIRYKMIKN